MFLKKEKLLLQELIASAYEADSRTIDFNGRLVVIYN